MDYRPGTPASAGSGDEDDYPSFTVPAYGAAGEGPTGARWRPPRLATSQTLPTRTGSPGVGAQFGVSPASTLQPTPYSSGRTSPASPYFSASSSINYQLGRSHSVELIASSGAPRSRLSTLQRLGRPPTPSPSSPSNGNYNPLNGSLKPVYSPYHDPFYSKYAKPQRSPFRLLAGICAAILLVGSLIMWWTVDVEKVEETGRILEGKKPRYVLYRILGNDLPPRHRVGQTYSNLQFILNHEPDFVDTEKWWLLNRIVDPQVEREIVDLLTRHRQKYVRVPFRDEEYVRRDFRLEDFPRPDYFRSREFLEHGHAARLRILDSSYHDKNQYVMNNNGGRNHAILHGRHAVRARWILPFDGNAFLTKRAWSEITRALEKHGDRYKYLVVPMHRLLNNTRALDENFRPLAREEPQIIFREDAEEMYDVRMRYGRRSKLELLWRLGVLPATPYLSNSSTFPWELNPQWRLSPSAGRFLRAGFVLRLFSGRPEQEVPSRRAASRRAYNRMLGVQSVIDGIDESIVGRVLNAPDIESPDVEDRKRSKGWWVYEQDAIQHARSVWQNRDRSTGNGLQGDVVRWVSRVLDLARSEINSAGTEGVTFKDMLDYVRPGPRQGRQRLAAEKHSQPKQLYVDVSLVEPTALSGALRRIALLVLASELSGDEEYAKTASIEVRRWILGEGMSLPPSVLTSQRKGLDQRTPNPKQHLMAASSQLPAFLDALRILHRDGRLVDAWQEIRQVLATMLRFLLASDIARDMDLKSREWQSVRGDAVIAALSGFLGDVRSWNRIITGARMRIGGSLGNDEGCLDIPQQATTSDEETDGAEILDGGKPLGSAQADNSREAKANSSAGSGASSNLQAQIPLAAGEQPVVSSPADTFLDALESRSHLLLWWTMLTRIYESGYGRFRHNAQDRGAWGDPTTVLGNLSPSLWHMRTSHALCKNVSVSDSVKVALKGLSLDIQRVWALWGMAPGHDLGAEEDSTVLTDESQDGTGSRDRPVSEQRGAFLRRYGVEVAELAKHGNEARRLKLRLARARLQYIAQVGLRLEAVRPASLRPVDSGSVDQAGQHSTSAGPGSDVIDIADLATSSRLKLRLYDDEPSDDLWQWKELWLKTPIAAFDKDGAAVGATMDLPFAWMLGLRN